ncbi:hypothetical protein F9802_02250 [Bacillus aerolatus]|uniref:Uncharacterized protein n=1 Tax=Bacillus aerolatus TaxID=2653354 RepID=A0A6I1FK54_9BACI|nr:hypothetical protein [Bacillus aerolatus]KAB7708980.1 hypothetical protein F9802_02250 [Bacillus aerolatus]
MFDPSAFDNIKFIMQAEVYDRDLDGLIHIHSRTDKVDLASLSREASISFSLKESPQLRVTLFVQADLDKLAGELKQLPGAEPGVMLQITYTGAEKVLTAERMDELEKMWGEERQYERRKVESNRSETVYEWCIHFNRTITEDMIEEFGSLVGFITDTLKAANKNE